MNQQCKALFVIGVFFLFLLMFNGHRTFPATDITKADSLSKRIGFCRFSDVSFELEKGPV